MPDDRRRDDRLRILGSVAGDLTLVQPIRLIDISASGASVDLEHPLALESLHQFRLRLGPQPVVVKGRVAYCRVSDLWPDHVIYRAGIEFVDLSPHVREAIGEYLASGGVTPDRA